MVASPADFGRRTTVKDNTGAVVKFEGLHGKRAALYIIITDLHLSILTNPPDSICLFVCLSTYLIIYTCVYMSVRRFIRPSVGLCLHMCTPWRLEKELGGGCGCVAVCLHVRLSICMTG